MYVQLIEAVLRKPLDGTKHVRELLFIVKLGEVEFEFLFI